MSKSIKFYYGGHGLEAAHSQKREMAVARAKTDETAREAAPP